MTLTKKQTETYRFIQQYISIHGYAPTEKEIASGIGIVSTGVVHRYVMALSNAGFISLVPNKRRNIRLINHGGAADRARSEFGMPLFGAIAAGAPIKAITDAHSGDDNHLDLGQLMGPNRFALKVSGDSMIGDNICDGDYVICESCNTASNGEIVVVLVDRDEVTLKRVQKNTCGTVSLIPSNQSMDALVLAANRICIQGRYLGLLRI